MKIDPPEAERMMESLREIFFKTDRIHYSTFDAYSPPLEGWTFDVRRSMFDVHQFLSRFDWPLFRPEAALK